MKTLSLLITLLSMFTNGWAQGTIHLTANLSGQFAIPPNSTEVTNYVVFDLTGNLLVYSVSIEAASFALPSAFVSGPATIDQLGLMVFDLGSYVATAGPDATINYLFSGNRTLTSQQTSELLSEQYWLNVTAAFGYPDHPILRGQMVAVPEPQALSLLATGLIGLAAARQFFR